VCFDEGIDNQQHTRRGIRRSSVTTTFGKNMEARAVGLDQRLLLCLGPSLELRFTFLSGRPRFVTFRIDDTHRQSTCGVLRATTFIVNALALDDVGCRADVERAIGTGGDVDEVGRGGRRHGGRNRPGAWAPFDSPETIRSLRTPFDVGAAGDEPAMSERGGPAKPAACESNGGSAWESNPAPPQSGERPILKTGRATGPRSLPERFYHRGRKGRGTRLPSMANRASMWVERERTTSPPPAGRPDSGIEVTPAPVTAGSRDVSDDD
jgi:hypothetical protein